MQNFSTAWFLTALILSCEEGIPTSLDQAIQTGDMINRSIFTTEEVNEAVNVLLHLDLIELSNDKCFLVTDKAYSFCDKTFMSLSSYSKMERIYKKLKKLSVELSVDRECKNVFTKEEVDAAYKKYQERCRKALS